MSTDTTAIRRTVVTLLGALALAATLLATMAPAVQGADACRVRNVTQGTHGRSFRAMVTAAVDGDRLTVRGTCESGVTIRTDLVITGVGDPRPVLTGRHRHRVLKVMRWASVTLRHLVLADGSRNPWHGGSTGDRWHGGGILTRGAVTLIDTVVRDNTDHSGGGVYNYGTLTLIDSVVRDNTADWVGGGIVNAGVLTITHSVVRDNTAENQGGGIANGGTLTMRRSSSVTGNTAGTLGGGIYHEASYGGPVTLLGGSSVTGNTPDDCVGTTAC